MSRDRQRDDLTEGFIWTSTREKTDTTNSGNSKQSLRLAVPVDAVGYVEAVVLAIDANTNNQKTWKLQQGLVSNQQAVTLYDILAGVLQMIAVGSTNATATAGWNAEFTANGMELGVEITGQALTFVNWYIELSVWAYRP